MLALRLCMLGAGIAHICIRVAITFPLESWQLNIAPALTRYLQVLSSGADGLVKLWSCRTGECANTFDEHAGKIWALATAGEGEKMIATGA